MDASRIHNPQISLAIRASFELRGRCSPPPHLTHVMSMIKNDVLERQRHPGDRSGLGAAVCGVVGGGEAWFVRGDWVRRVRAEAWT